MNERIMNGSIMYSSQSLAYLVDPSDSLLPLGGLLVRGLLQGLVGRARARQHAEAKYKRELLLLQGRIIFFLDHSLGGGRERERAPLVRPSPLPEKVAAKSFSLSVHRLQQRPPSSWRSTAPFFITGFSSFFQMVPSFFLSKQAVVTFCLTTDRMPG